MTVMSLAEFDVVNIKFQFRPHLNRFNFQQIETPEVNKLLKEIDVKKGIGIDTNSSKIDQNYCRQYCRAFDAEKKLLVESRYFSR